jgi:hypothetical protein
MDQLTGGGSQRALYERRHELGGRLGDDMPERDLPYEIRDAASSVTRSVQFEAQQEPNPIQRYFV